MERENQVFITDLDGTLLNSRGFLSETSVEILNQVAHADHKIAFATARGLTSARAVIQSVAWNFPVILNNGSVIYDWQTQKIMKINGIANSYVNTVLELGASMGISPLVFTLNEKFEEGIFYQENPSTGLRYFMDMRSQDPRFIEVNQLQQDLGLYDTQCLVLMFIEDYDTLVPLKLQLQEQYGQDVKCLLMQDQYIPNAFVLEVSSTQATKEHGIAYLQEQFSIQGEVLHLFGDNLNDKGMLELKANTYAVHNAHPAILDLVQHTIASNDHDGVAQTIRQLTETKG